MRTGLLVGSLEVKETSSFNTVSVQRLFFGAGGPILKSWSAGGGRKERNTLHIYIYNSKPDCNAVACYNSQNVLRVM